MKPVSLTTVLSIYLKKNWGHCARLREKEKLFRYRAKFEGNLLHFIRARAHVRALMTRESCAVEMRNAILGNDLNRVMQDHEARASDLNRKLIFSFFLLFS